MRCDTCHGAGVVMEADALEILDVSDLGHGVFTGKTRSRPVPCEECGGTGISHCCDGLVACDFGELTGQARPARLESDVDRKV